MLRFYTTLLAALCLWHSLCAAAEGGLSVVSEYATPTAKKICTFAQGKTISGISYNTSQPEEFYAIEMDSATDIGSLLVYHVGIYSGPAYEIKLGLAPTAPKLFSSDDTFGFCLNRPYMVGYSENGSVNIIDLDKKQRAAVIDTSGKRTISLVQNQKLQELYAVNSDNGTVDIIDIKSLKVTATVNLESASAGFCAVDVKHARLFVLDSDRSAKTVKVIDLMSQKVVASLATEVNSASGLYVNSSANMIYVSSASRYNEPSKSGAFDLNTLEYMGRSNLYYPPNTKFDAINSPEKFYVNHGVSGDNLCIFDVKNRKPVSVFAKQVSYNIFGPDNQLFVTTFPKMNKGNYTNEIDIYSISGFKSRLENTPF